MTSATAATRSNGSSNVEKRSTPRSSTSHSNDQYPQLQSPLRSVANSQCESLGASMSDLSSEAPSEFSEHNRSLNSQKSTPSKNVSKLANSKLPIPKKSTKRQ